MSDPDLHASPPNRGVDPVGERGHVRHTGGARATDVPVGGRAVVGLTCEMAVDGRGIVVRR